MVGLELEAGDMVPETMLSYSLCTASQQESRQAGKDRIEKVALTNLRISYKAKLPHFGVAVICKSLKAISFFVFFF